MEKKVNTNLYPTNDYIHHLTLVVRIKVTDQFIMHSAITTLIALDYSTIVGPSAIR